MIEHPGSLAKSRCGLGLPTKRHRSVLWVSFLFAGFMFHPKIAAAQTGAVPLPRVMHFCSANCFTLTWDNGHYIGL